MPSSRPRISSRHYGHRPACDQCRARKLACDRSQPACSRCQRARHNLQCTYPSPPGSGIGNPTPVASIAPASRTRATRKSLRNATSSLGYLGYTSHNNILEETQIDLFLADGVGSQPHSAVDDSMGQQHVAFDDLLPPLQESALLVLRRLPGQVDEQMSFQQPSGEPKGWAHIANDRIVQSLRVEFKDLLHQGEPGLRALAVRLCNNTRQSIENEGSAALPWIDQLSGKSLRWESIGLLWANMAHISDDVDSLRSPKTGWCSNNQSYETARDCLGYCIELARSFTQGNDVLLDLCRRKSVLDSILDGDARISSYASHSLAVTMLTYLGLHVLENGPFYRPSLRSENQRRVFAQIFTTDKLGVSFTGRPPLIIYNFCSTPIPLDIRDEDLVSDDATLVHAFHSLDDQGWNTVGAVYPSTVIRARYIVAVIRDELLGIALHKRPPLDIVHLLLEIKARQLKVASGFPSGLAYHPEDLNDLSIDAQMLYFKITVQLDHLKNIFFAERLLLRHGEPNSEELLHTSVQLVSLTVELWKRRDAFGSPCMLRDFEWLLLEYGASAGGILCQELLRSALTGSYTPYAGVSRSSIVQKLSLLVGFLDWVPLSAPNGPSCASCKQIIQRVLDLHLNAPAGLGGGEVLERLRGDPLALPSFRFELLNGFDWLSSGT